jgi:hypothetical protein
MARSKKPAGPAKGSDPDGSAGKIVKLSGQSALLLVLSGFAATNVWTVTNHHRLSLNLPPGGIRR